REKEVEIPGLEAESVLTITKTVTTVQREEQVVSQQVRPVFVAPLEPEIYVRERGIARLECRVDAAPAPIITWFVNGMEIKPSPHYEIRYEDGKSILLIIEVGPQDTGEYTCTATSELGEAVSSTTLYVQEPVQTDAHRPEDTSTLLPSPAQTLSPPVFLESMKDVVAVDGQELHLKCRVSGTPMPTISFFHDSKNIDDDEEFVISYNPETGEVCLIIVEVFPEDQGQYICVARNPAGQATTSAYLSVQETKEITMELEAEQPQEETITIDTTVPQKIEFIIKPQEEAPLRTKPQPSEVTEDVVMADVIDRPKVVEAFLEKVTQVKEITVPVVPQPEISEITFPVEPAAEVPTVEKEEVTLIIEQGSSEQIQVLPEEPLEVSKMEIDVTDSGIPTPPDAGPLEEETSIQTVIGEVQDFEQPPQQIIPEQAPDEVAPEFVEMLQPQVVGDGDSLRMTCRLIGSPTPVVTWYKNTTEINTGPDIRLYYEPETGLCVLEVTEVFPDDAGEITCRAQNQFGEAMTTATLIVQETEETEVTTTEETITTSFQVEEGIEEETEVKVIEEKHVTTLEVSPNFSKPLQPYTQVDEGGTVRFEVIVEAEPEATVKWYKNEVQIFHSPRVEVIREKNVHILLITDVRPEDSGDYICEAENIVGRTVCKTTLTVNPLQRMEIEIQPEEMPREQPATEPKREIAPEEPKPTEEAPKQVPQETVAPEEGLEGQPPRFTQLLQPLTVRDTQRVELTVRYTGVPSPTITWYFDGSPILPSSDFQITIDVERGESTLIIVEVFPEDEGEYTCIAVNPFGESITTCRLTVI
ncbi:unnamed protein product, partial [Candidula unifasciata]